MAVPVRTSRLGGCEQRFGHTLLQRSVPHTCVTHSSRADPDGLSDSRTASNGAVVAGGLGELLVVKLKGSLRLREQSRAGCHKSDGDMQEAVHPVHGLTSEMFTFTNILLRGQLPTELQRYNF